MFHFIPLEAQLKKSGLVLIAGIDEAGRGPLAGPVVSAAVILKENAKLPNLNDSKKLTPHVREKLFGMILKSAIDYSITIVPHATIDEMNILNATIFANYLCVRHLRVKPDIALLDGRDKQIIVEKHQNIIKGDEKIRVIAAASILAKVVRDRLMTHYAGIYKNYGFEKHMGYLTRLHRSNISKYGLCEIHRKSYTFK